jgi:hypothetical protein
MITSPVTTLRTLDTPSGTVDLAIVARPGLLLVLHVYFPVSIFDTFF